MKSQAKAFYDANRFSEALPLLEKIALAEPNNGENQYYLAFALIGHAVTVQDPAARKELRIRGRNAFIKTLELGVENRSHLELVKAMAEGIPADGSDPAGFSDIKEANESMRKGEAAFASGKMDEAITHYEAALKLDPRIYHAALFAGDANMHGGKYDQAEIWYQRAIKINPFIETGYRYSATPFMKQKKYDVARDRYVEAYIVAPYSRLALSGILQWGEATETRLAHPRVDVPKITVDAAGKTNVNINVNPLVDDGSMAWISYSTTREEWRNSLFAKKYPGKPYRHTLEEEAAALRSVVKMAKDLKAKNLNAQIDMLGKMDADGVLEAFIIIAIADEDIAYHHPL
jgi:tetratricopeptide (TPR) repeat protein